LRIITRVKTWVYCYELWGHCFQDIPEVQRQSLTVLHMISKKYFLAVLPEVAELLDLLH